MIDFFPVEFFPVSEFSGGVEPVDRLGNGVRLGGRSHLIASTCGNEGSFRISKKSRKPLQKDFAGGSLIMTGANSGVGLRSTAVKRLMLDEL